MEACFISPSLEDLPSSGSTHLSSCDVLQNICLYLAIYLFLFFFVKSLMYMTDNISIVLWFFLDGLREKDRTILNNTLLSVATCKDNTFHLMRHIWNEVQEDWPFYSDLDRKNVKK